MKVVVRFFAGPREALGVSELARELPDGLTVGDLLDRLAGEYPALRSYLGFLHLAVNLKYADLQTVLHDGDEMVCVPPVGGG